jgi:hypothetical protein
METIIINIPDKKSKLVKQILKELGVTIQEKSTPGKNYREKLLQGPVWTDDEVKLIEDAGKSFDSLKPAQW